MSSQDGGNAHDPEEEKEAKAANLDADNDDLMSGSELDPITQNKNGTKDNIDYASLPSIEQLLEQHIATNKLG